MRDEIDGCLFWLIIIGFLFSMFVETQFAQLNPSTCRDATITQINIDLQSGNKTYTAKSDSDDVEFASMTKVNIGDLVTVCNYKTPLGILTMQPYVSLRITE